MTTQETALQQLLDKKAIEELRYTYWYSILDKDIDRLVSCFCETIKLEYGFGVELNGKAEAEAFFISLLNSPGRRLQIPRGANGLIDIIDENFAKGRWLVEAVTLRDEEQIGSQASVQYFEEYSKVNGEWKLAFLKNNYLYFESVQSRDNP